MLIAAEADNTPLISGGPTTGHGSLPLVQYMYIYLRTMFL